jgi:hypothetical protein
MSPGTDADRHSPAFRAMQYLYASALVSPKTSPVVALLVSIKGCIPQNAHVGWSFLVILPNSPDEPVRLLEPLVAQVPELPLHDHNGHVVAGHTS